MSVKNGVRRFVGGFVAVVASVCLLAGCGSSQPVSASSKKSSVSSVPAIPVEYDWHGFDARKSGAGVHPEITSPDEACRKVAPEAVYWITAKDGPERYRQLFKRFYLRLGKSAGSTPWYVGGPSSDFTHTLQPPYQGKTNQKFDNEHATCVVYIVQNDFVELTLSKLKSGGWTVSRFYWPKEYYKGGSNQNMEG